MAYPIRRAGVDEIDNLVAIALAAKGHWGYPQHLLDAWAQAGILKAEALTEDDVFVAEADGRPAGWYRLIFGRTPAELEDLWVLPDAMGRGFGRTLFEHAKAQAGLHGACALELDADPHAVPFYEHMGCRVVGESWSSWGRMIPRMRISFGAETRG